MPTCPRHVPSFANLSILHQGSLWYQLVTEGLNEQCCTGRTFLLRGGPNSLAVGTRFQGMS